MVQLPLAATVAPVALSVVSPEAGVNVGAIPTPEQVAVAAGVAATLMMPCEAPPASGLAAAGNTSVMPIPVMATGLGLVTVMVSVVLAPPSVSVVLVMLLLMLGLVSALTLILWLTAPELATAAPSLPVTAPLATV